MTHEETEEKEQQSKDNGRLRARRGYLIVGGIISIIIIWVIIGRTNDTPKNPASEVTKEPPKKRAMQHYRAGEYAEAIKAYDEAIRKPPTDEDPTDLYLQRGRAKFELKHYEAAVYDFREMIHLQSDLATAYYWLGWVDMKMEEYSDAITNFTTAIETDPDPYEYLARGQAKYYNAPTYHDEESRNKEYNAAVDDFTEAIRREPGETLAYLYRGVCKEKLGESEAAIYDYSEAIQLSGDYARAYFNRGLSYMNIGRKDDANKDYDKAMELAEQEGDTDLQNSIRRARR